MTALVEKSPARAGRRGSNCARRRPKPQAGRQKHFVFAYRPPTKAFNLKLSFNKTRA
jgi:hypothetical protein